MKKHKWTTRHYQSEAPYFYERHHLVWEVDGPSHAVAGIVAHCHVPDTEDWLFDGDADTHPVLGPGTGLAHRWDASALSLAKPTLIQV